MASRAERRRAWRHPDASDVFIIVRDFYTVLKSCQGPADMTRAAGLPRRARQLAGSSGAAARCTSRPDQADIGPQVSSTTTTDREGGACGGGSAAAVVLRH